MALNLERERKAVKREAELERSSEKVQIDREQEMNVQNTYG